jgi:hypothetical protein
MRIKNLIGMFALALICAAALAGTSAIAQEPIGYCDPSSEFVDTHSVNGYGVDCTTVNKRECPWYSWITDVFGYDSCDHSTCISCQAQ